jgi:hypothetical protein
VQNRFITKIVSHSGDARSVTPQKPPVQPLSAEKSAKFHLKFPLDRRAVWRLDWFAMTSPSERPACPYLPLPSGPLDYRELRQHGPRRDADFYYSALCYGQVLWLDGYAGRALLAITRALYADLRGDEAILQSWPLPYAALRWILEHHDSDDFPGNPRLSYQHQACRMRPPRQELRAVRAWAVWALACDARPTLLGDPSLPEISLAHIHAQLVDQGLPCEAELWREQISAE